MCRCETWISSVKENQDFVVVVVKFGFWYESFHLILEYLLSKDVAFKNYRTVILPTVLYRCETGLSHCGKDTGWGCWGTGWRECLDLSGWGKLQEVLYNLYCLTNIVRIIKSRRMRWERCVARRDWISYNVMVRKPEEWDAREHIYKDNIKIDLK
jgi:hypothetical protein